MNRRKSIKWAPKIFCPSEEDKLIWPLQFLTNSMDITDLSPLSCLLVMCSELSLEKKSPEEYGIGAVVCNWILKKTTKHSAQGKKPKYTLKKITVKWRSGIWTLLLLTVTSNPIWIRILHVVLVIVLQKDCYWFLGKRVGSEVVQGLELYVGITSSEIILREGRDCNKIEEALRRQ